MRLAGAFGNRQLPEASDPPKPPNRLSASKEQTMDSFWKTLARGGLVAAVAVAGLVATGAVRAAQPGQEEGGNAPAVQKAPHGAYAGTETCLGCLDIILHNIDSFRREGLFHIIANIAQLHPQQTCQHPCRNNVGVNLVAYVGCNFSKRHFDKLKKT